jgi:pyruvate formate lyase activating enzyme
MSSIISYLENIQKLCRLNKRIWIRVPLIPEVNDGDELEKIKQFIAKLDKVEKVEFLPYHAYGEGKYALLGQEFCK